jgi:hypothetical protein
MTIGAVILWVHVLCGVVWVAVCATFILAAAALGGEPKESSVFVIKIAPQINRLSVPLAIAIPVTGIGNLLSAVRTRGSTLPVEFIGIVAAKIGLLVIMALALVAAWHAAQRLDERLPMGASEPLDEVNIRRVMAFYGLIVGSGIVALGLGLWLSGT